MPILSTIVLNWKAPFLIGLIIHKNCLYQAQAILFLVIHIFLFQFILLGAVPFPSDVPCLKKLGVNGVVTLNEPYETLVPTALYKVSITLAYMLWLPYPLGILRAKAKSF